MKDAPSHIFRSGEIHKFVKFITDAMTSTNVHFVENATLAAGKLLLLHNETKSPYTNMKNDVTFIVPEEDIKSLVEDLAKSALVPSSNTTDLFFHVSEMLLFQ